MTDGIIKGGGNSRFLRSVPNVRTLYPTHDDLLDALAAGTFPIDLNGINPSGWEQVGDKLDKSTLLTDALCTALGLATTATPTQAMEKLRQLVTTAQEGANNAAKFTLVSYAGTGRGGTEAKATHLAFPFPPKFLWFYGVKQVGDTTPGIGNRYSLDSNAITISDLTLWNTTFTQYAAFGYQWRYSWGKISSDRKHIYFYCNYTDDELSNADGQLNSRSWIYYFYAIG